MTENIDDGIPWPPASWARMVEEAALWLDQAPDRRAPDVSKLRLLRARRPASPWSIHTRRGYTLVPLNTSNRQLAASLMLEFPTGHRVEEHGTATARTFIARAPGRSPVAIHLTQQGNAWKPTGVAVARHERAGRYLTNLAESLAKAVTSHDRRHRASPVSHGTGPNEYLYIQERKPRTNTAS